MICACETWLDNKPEHLPRSLYEYEICWANAQREYSVGRSSGGLATLTKKDLKWSLIDKSNWWIFGTIRYQNFKIIVGSVYFKPSLNLETMLDLLQLTITDLQEKHEADFTVIGGDFNARVGEEEDDIPHEVYHDTVLSPTRQSCDKTVNIRGSTVMDFMKENGFILVNGRSPSDQPGQFTFSSTVGHSTIDLIWVNVPSLEAIDDLFVVSEISPSDHFPVTLVLNLPWQDVSACFNNLEIPQTAVTKLKWKPEQAETFQSALKFSNRVFFNFGNSTPNDQYENFLKAIVDAATFSNMYSTSSGRVFYSGKCRDKPWFVGAEAKMR